MTILGNP